VIEAEVTRHKRILSVEMEAWMEEQRTSMQRDYQQRVDAAVKEALDGKSSGAPSVAQQPDLA